MKPGGPWNLRGLRPQAREAARDAARQSGVSVGEWLNGIIEQDDNEEAGPAWSDEFDRPSGGDRFAEPRRRDRIDSGMAPVRHEGGRYDDEHHGGRGGEQHNRNREDPPRDRQRDQERDAARNREEAPHRDRQRNQERDAARSREQARKAREEARDAARKEAREAARRESQREAARTREGIGEVHARLDRLSQQLERISQVEGDKPPLTLQHVPPPPPGERDDVSPRLTGVPRRRLVRLEPLAGATPTERLPAGNHAPADSPGMSIEDAVAEIAARQRALDGEPPAKPVIGSSPVIGASLGVSASPVVSASPAAAGTDAASPPPSLSSPSIDLSALERQLRHITSQIETLRPNEIESAISGFRNDLVEIERRLTEALPRRALESLEIEIKALGERIDHSRQSGVDSSALGGLEHELAEVRQALRTLTPAENLIGFDEAVRALAQKVDLIIAREDPAALQQLESAIGGLRGIVSHVASNDTLTKVAEDVRSLAAQIDGLASHAASGRDILVLENRIDALTNALGHSAEVGQAVPRELEKLLAGLIEKLEWVQLTHTDHAALAHLEDRIATLVARFDTSDARLGHLEAIERGLSDLLVHLDEIRGSYGRGDRELRLAPASVDAIERDVAEIRQIERRTQDSLNAVQGTVEHVVDRLATIESGLQRGVISRAEPPAELPAADPAPLPAAHQPDFEDEAVANPPVAPSEFGDEVPDVQIVEEPAPAPTEMVTPRITGRPPLDPNLPPNHPLEPGLSAGRSPTASAADRIAASEAAIAPAKPPVIADNERPNFIAAARRAAQAAAWSQSGRQPGGQPAEVGPQPNKLSQRVHKLLVAGAVVLIVVGCWHIASRLFDDGSPTPPPQAEKSSPPAQSKEAPEEVTPSAKPDPTPGTVPSEPHATVPPVKPARQSMIQGSSSDTAAAPPETVAAATTMWPPADITGALPRRAAARAAGPDGTVNDDKLPATIGGPALRAAALAGDPAAAYEVATRFAEGHGVPQNSQEAVHWLERAARQGLAPAQFRLGGLYEKGIGVKKDLVAARDLYLAAAEKGNGKSMHNLAVLYAEGINGPPDYRSAALWFRRAADHGMTDSQYNLGILYARGIGVEQNYAEAYKWFVLAANQGDQEAAKKRDEVAGYLNQQTLEAARLAVQNWSAQPQPPEAITVKTAAEWDLPSGGPQPVKPKPRPAVKNP
jgi:localization factor PodJL